MSAWHYWRVYYRSLGSKLAAAQLVEQRKEGVHKKKGSQCGNNDLYIHGRAPMLVVSYQAAFSTFPLPLSMTQYPSVSYPIGGITFSRFSSSSNIPASS